MKKIEDLQTDSLFDTKIKKPKKVKVLISDIRLISGYEIDDYMSNTIEGLGLLDDNIFLVRKGGKFEVKDGMRRLTALKKAGETETMAYIFDDIEDYKASLITLATNNARSNNPSAELDAIMALEKAGVSPAAIRKLTNVSKAKISKLRSILNLVKPLQMALRKNKLTFTMAYEISKMLPKDQEKLLKIYEANGILTGDDLKSVKTKRKETIAKELPDSLFEEIEFNRVDKLIADYMTLTKDERIEYHKKIDKIL